MAGKSKRCRSLHLEMLEDRTVPAVLGPVPLDSTPFTLDSPTSAGALPEQVTVVGGVVIDMVGINGTRVVSQLPASSLHEGFFSSSDGVIGTQLGFSQEVLDALGGGISELAVRITLHDGDTALGNFDDGDNFLVLNGIQIGDFSDVVTVATTSDGTVIGSTGTGFADSTLNTGFFYTNDTQILADFFANLTESQSVQIVLRDGDPDDNYFDFTQGLDGDLVDIGTPPAPTNTAPVAENVLLTADENSTKITVLNSATDAELDPLEYLLDADSVPEGWLASLSADGTLSVTPPSGFTGQVTLNYSVSDGKVATEATITLNVVSVADAGDANQLLAVIQRAKAIYGNLIPAQILVRELVAAFPNIFPNLGSDTLILIIDPVDWTLTTADGQTISEQGGKVTGVGNVFYAQDGVNEVLIVPNASKGNVNLALTGVGTGEYVVSASYVEKSGQVTTKAVSGNLGGSKLAVSMDFTNPDGSTSTEVRTSTNLGGVLTGDAKRAADSVTSALTTMGGAGIIMDNASPSGGNLLANSSLRPRTVGAAELTEEQEWVKQFLAAMGDLVRSSAPPETSNMMPWLNALDLILESYSPLAGWVLDSMFEEKGSELPPPNQPDSVVIPDLPSLPGELQEDGSPLAAQAWAMVPLAVPLALSVVSRRRKQATR